MHFGESTSSEEVLPRKLPKATRMRGAIRVSSSTSFIDNALTVSFHRRSRIDEQESLVIGRAYSSSMIYPMSGQGKIFNAVLVRYVTVEQKSGAGNVSDAIRM